MPATFESRDREYSNSSLTSLDIGGREIMEYETRRRIPDGLSLRIHKEHPTATVLINRDAIEWDIVASLVRSAESVEVPDSVHMNFEFRDGRVEIGADDEATLMLIQQFYHGHGDKMGIVHTGDGTGSVSIMRYPIPGTPSCGPLRGYEVIAAGAQFTLLKPIAVADALGA